MPPLRFRLFRKTEVFKLWAKAPSVRTWLRKLDWQSWQAEDIPEVFTSEWFFKEKQPSSQTLSNSRFSSDFAVRTFSERFSPFFLRSGRPLRLPRWPPFSIDWYRFSRKFQLPNLLCHWAICTSSQRCPHNVSKCSCLLAVSQRRWSTQSGRHPFVKLKLLIWEHTKGALPFPNTQLMV